MQLLDENRLRELELFEENETEADSVSEETGTEDALHDDRLESDGAGE